MIMDFETGDRDPYTCPVIQLAAIVIHPRTLEIHENGIFESMIRPPNLDEIKQDALDVNKKSIEEIKAAPDQDVVWKNFVQFVNKFKTEQSDWGLPILAGHNIIGFDKIIIDRLCKQYKTKICHPFNIIDTISLSFYWFESRADVSRYSLDYLRDKFGLSREAAHDAKKDCLDTLEILTRYLKLARNISPKLKFISENENN
jgi:DNA polymerase III epsilon subunit-like protein